MPGTGRTATTATSRPSIRSRPQETRVGTATVRATTRDLGAQIVLCLHDELLVHVPEEHAHETRARVETALTDSARRWAGSSAVRFVADTSVVRRWSEAKD